MNDNFQLVRGVTVPDLTGIWDTIDELKGEGSYFAERREG